ncbi:hypothetical protein VSQ48_02160 [Candidatus Ventrimonas sp. KK005]
MRSLTDEAKEIVREFMADGKVATRKMVAEQVEKNISRPNEYRVNILNGVIKVLTENHELDVVERGKYQLGKGLARKTHEELALMYLMNCKENMGSLCSIEGTDTSEDKKQFIMKVTDTVIEIDKLLVRFNGGVKPVEAEKKVEPAKEVERADKKAVEPEKKAEKTEEKAVEKPVKAEKKVEPAKAEKKAAPKTEKKDIAKTEKKEVAKAEKKEDKPVERAVAPKVEKKAEPAKKEEEVAKKEVDKEVKIEKAEPVKAEKEETFPAVVKKEEAPKAEQKAVEKKEVLAK